MLTKISCAFITYNLIDTQIECSTSDMSIDASLNFILELIVKVLSGLTFQLTVELPTVDTLGTVSSTSIATEMSAAHH